MPTIISKALKKIFGRNKRNKTSTNQTNQTVKKNSKPFEKMALNPKFAELFGSKLLRGTEEVDTLTALKDAKAIAIYFSAHWCPPCRGFTPKLKEWYEKDLKAKGLEVVFASSDRDESAFQEYFKEMPWLALPYAERELKNKLASRLECQGIPYLCIITPDGAISTKGGRAAVTGDPTGENLPWKQQSISDLLDTKFENKEGGSVSLDDLKGKKIGLYFSAHWCPPCRNFTPKFAEVYKKIAKEKNLEVIFCSSDRDEAAFKEYYATMPWLTLPFADRKRKEDLSQRFGVQGIPTLVLLDEDRNIITDEAVQGVHGDPEGAKFPWLPEPVNEIDECPSGIDEGQSLVVLQSKIPEEQQKANTAILLPLAEAESKRIAENKKKAESASVFEDTAGAKEFRFFVANSGGSLCQRVRSECRVSGEDGVQIVLMDIPDKGAFYAWPKDKELTKDNVEAFFEDYKAGKLERKQMGAEE